MISMLSKLFQWLFSCQFKESLCVGNGWGCRCGKGKAKTTTTTDQGQKSTFTPQQTPQEQELNQLALQQQRAVQPGVIGTEQAGLDITQRLLRGEALPGGYGDLYGGISPDITSNIVQQSLLDINPQFQQGGLLDSGVRASISARVAGDIRNQAAQFNITNRGNLLAMGLGGQGQSQQPILGYSSLLSNRLTGLRPTTSTGAQWGTTTGLAPNPFVTSFQQEFGKALGKGTAGGLAGVFGWGGQGGLQGLSQAFGGGAAGSLAASG